MRVVIHGPRRHLPTSVPYRSDPLSAFTVEAEVADLAALDRLLQDGTLAKIREAQNGDLDAQEAAFAAKYRVQSPVPADQVVKAPEQLQADALREAEKQLKQPITAETRAEVRRLAIQYLEAVGKPHESKVPVTEAEGVALIRTLADALQSGRDRKYPAKADGLSLQQRACTGAHRDPVALSSGVYEYSVQHYGRPLCQEHQARRQG